MLITMRRTLLAACLLASLLTSPSAFGQAPPAVPALPDTERRTSYSISGTTCACNVNFALFSSGTDVDNWIQVWINGTRYLSTDPIFGWSLSSATGSLSTIPRPITDAVLTFNAVQTGTVQIVGADRPRQLTQFTEGRGVAARDLNQRFTEDRAIEREVWDKINDVTGRSILSQPGNTMGPLPLPANCVNGYLNFGANGLTPTCNNIVPTGSIVTPGTTVVNDLPLWGNTIGTQFTDSGINMPTAGNAILFANPAGSDSTTNYCLSSGSPCTLRRACAARAQLATFLSGNPQINLASGTYSAVDANSAICTVIGNNGGSSPALTAIFGAGWNGSSCTSPTSSILAVPANDSGLYVKDNGEAGIHCVEFTGGNSSVGIQNAGQAAVTDYDNVTWGAWGTGGSHVSGTDGSYINLNANGETITANVAIHWNISGTARLNAGGVTTIQNTPAWATAFANAGPMSRLDVSGWSFSGSSTGVRFNGTGPGYLNTAANAACNSVMPGNSACSFQLGFQDGNSDGSTGSGPTVYQNAPTIEDQIIWSHTYAGLPASPTTGQFSHIVDGLAANCNDSLCVTPGTAVTAGGGSLDLWLKYDTTWRLVAANGIPNATKFNGYGSGVATAIGTNTNASGGFPTVPVANAQLANSSITISGITINLGGNYAPARNQTLPSNPTGTSSATPVMAGLSNGVTRFTPNASGNILFTISGTAQNTNSGNGCVVIIRYGTGNGPANAASSTGTTAGAASGQQATSNSAGGNVPFSITAYATGLSLSTAYYYDLAFNAVTGGTCSLTNITMTAMEM